MRTLKTEITSDFKEALRAWIETHEEYRQEDGNVTPDGQELCADEFFKYPLKYWMDRKTTPIFRDFYAMAATCLAIPATECASERVFKRTKRLATPERTHLLEDKLEQLAVIGLNMDDAELGNIDNLMEILRHAQ